MLEIVFLLVTTGGIAAYARGRGGNPWLWGTISVAGHLLIQFFGGLALALLHLRHVELFELQVLEPALCGHLRGVPPAFRPERISGQEAVTAPGV
jgi:hypothetical protein